ncbi:hypothetical protein PFISCL1PPCAC_9896, partial [Pristionchus fissidentatus]
MGWDPSLIIVSFRLMATVLALLESLVEGLAQRDVRLGLRAAKELLPLELARLGVLLCGVSSLLGSAGGGGGRLGVRRRSTREHATDGVSHCRSDGDSSRRRGHLGHQTRNLRGSCGHGSSSSGCGCSRRRGGHGAGDGSGNRSGRRRSDARADGRRRLGGRLTTDHS